MIVIILSCFSIALAVKCPNPSVKQNFDVTKYVGRWYEIQRFPLKGEDGLNCNQADYTLLNSTAVKVNNTGFDPVKNEWDYRIGQAKIADPNEPAKLLVKFSANEPEAPYWILDTDYDNYSLVFSCATFLAQKFEIVWILSREKTLNEKVVDVLKNTLESYNIDVSKFIIINQTNCPSNSR